MPVLVCTLLARPSALPVATLGHLDSTPVPAPSPAPSQLGWWEAVSRLSPAAPDHSIRELRTAPETRCGAVRAVDGGSLTNACPGEIDHEKHGKLNVWSHDRFRNL